jgi:diadenosine tetraphosphatase ApaH/serine/threonine PP2A family protein phosphatase
MGDEPVQSSVDLYWLPLGAGGHFVRWNGRLYERWSARREHRASADLYHCGLMLCLDDITYAVEMGPVWNLSDADRGVLAEGPVGSKRLGRFRAFRYELRCWPGGHIPDVAEAVNSPVRVTDDPTRVATVLECLREIPALTWGRDELGAGEMWNSNSAVAWVLARTGHEIDAIEPPLGGRAPGWTAGLVLAERQARAMTLDPGITGR